jgi:uncharacterized protein
MDPIVLFFLLGLLAGILRSELRLPPAIYEFLSILLLVSIGLKGGVELAQQPFLALFPKMVAVTALGLLLPLIAYPVLQYLGKFKRVDAASIAAHYGSVSVGTYAVAVTYLNTQRIPFEEYFPLFLVLLEFPAIMLGIALAHGLSRKTQWRKLTHEVVLGRSIVLLVGGLFIGWIAGPIGIQPLEGLFFDLFQGILALFLLEMGLITARQVGGLRRYGLFLGAFGILMPLFSSVIGAGLAWALGLSLGGTILLATLAASASYIAVPAAMRLALPSANPGLSLAAALGITFPFNVLVGIPIYHRLATLIHQWGGV